MAGKLRQKFGSMFKRSGGSDVVKREENSREAVLTELRQGYGKLVDTMQDVRGHMEDQARRSDRIIEVIEALPEVLRAIPESTDRQNQMLEGLTHSLRAQNKSTGELTNALGGLAKATQSQEASLTTMHDRLNGTLAQGEQSQRAMIDGIEKMSGAIVGVTQDQRDGRNTLAIVAEQTRRQQKQMLAMTGVSWALAVVALGVAGYVAIMVTRVASNNIAGRPAATPADNADAAGNTPEALGEPDQGAINAGDEMLGNESDAE